MFNNESAFQVFRGEIKLALNQGAVYYDCMKNEFFQMKVEEKNGDQVITLDLAPYGSCIVFDCSEPELPVYETLTEKLEACKCKSKLSENWSYSLATQKQYPEFTMEGHLEKLKPISHIHPGFSGHICYTKQIHMSTVGGSMYLEFEHVAEVLELWINEQYVDTIQYPPYVFDVSGYFTAGQNTIKAIVATTLDKDQNHYPEPFIVLNHDISEGTGMYGEIVLHFQEERE